MPLFKRGDDDDNGDEAGQDVAVGNAPAEEAPQAGEYQVGSLAGIPDSGRERPSSPSSSPSAPPSSIAAASSTAPPTAARSPPIFPARTSRRCFEAATGPPGS